PQEARADLDERLEDHEEREQPEDGGVTPVMRGLQRAVQRAPGVLDEPGQAHDEPCRPDDGRPGVAEQLLGSFADAEGPPGVVRDEAVAGRVTSLCHLCHNAPSHWILYAWILYAATWREPPEPAC